MDRKIKTMLRAATDYVIVWDGAYHWVGQLAEIHDWLSEHGADARRGEVKLTADSYEDLCSDTVCYVSGCGSYGPAGVDQNKLIRSLERRGARSLIIL